MKFKALDTIILWHEGAMKVFNTGDKGDLPLEAIQQYIDGKQAVELKGKAAKADAEEPVADADGDAPATPVADADAPPA